MYMYVYMYEYICIYIASHCMLSHCMLNGLKSKVGLAAAKTAAMRIDGGGVVAPPVYSSQGAASRQV